MDNGDGTVTDLNTGLMWTKSPDWNGDGVINSEDKMTYQEALEFVEAVFIVQCKWGGPERIHRNRCKSLDSLH